MRQSCDKQSGRIWLAAGGTGGHVFPAVHTANHFQACGFEVRMITDSRGVHLLPTALKRTVIAAASPFTGSALRRLFALIKLSIGFCQILALLLIRRPRALIGYGGYPAAAPTLAAWLLRIPVWLHEQNAVMGRSNRILARLVRQVFTSWPETRDLPKAVSCLHTGLPVAQSFAALPSYKANPVAQELHLAVFGGSLGARLFAEILPQAVMRLPAAMKRTLRISQQAHVDQIATLQSAYADQKIDADIRPFFENVAEVMTSTDLVLCRAGASTVAELAAAGRPSILIPYAKALDDHQQANARQLATIGGTQILREAEITADRLAMVIGELLRKPEQRQRQALAARRLARPTAAATIVETIETYLFCPKPEVV